MKRAIFLDRDGVLNRNVWNRSTLQFEAPLTVAQFELCPGVIPALRLFLDAGYLLFLVSNQPNYVKGKSSMAELEAIHRTLTRRLEQEGIHFSSCYYCFHHPEFTGACPCRKPSPYFLQKAAKEFEVALSESWMIGDRATDVECGRSAGTRTIRIGSQRANDMQADYVALDVWSAARLIVGRMPGAIQQRPYDAALVLP